MNSVEVLDMTHTTHWKGSTANHENTVLSCEMLTTVDFCSWHELAAVRFLNKLFTSVRHAFHPTIIEHVRFDTFRNLRCAHFYDGLFHGLNLDMGLGRLKVRGIRGDDGEVCSINARRVVHTAKPITRNSANFIVAKFRILPPAVVNMPESIKLLLRLSAVLHKLLKHILCSAGLKREEDTLGDHANGLLGGRDIVRLRASLPLGLVDAHKLLLVQVGNPIGEIGAGDAARLEVVDGETVVVPAGAGGAILGELAHAAERVGVLAGAALLLHGAVEEVVGRRGMRRGRMHGAGWGLLRTRGDASHGLLHRVEGLAGKGEAGLWMAGWGRWLWFGEGVGW